MNENVINYAIKMCQNSYAPFSNYYVGAAVETISNDIIGGCNVELSSYSLTCCAERVALFHAIAKGHSNFISMAVVTENGVMPCGACRQVIWELCGEIPIYICNLKGHLRTVSSLDLLPNPFDKTKLK